MAKPKLIVLALNEINFDVVARYAERELLPGFKKLMECFRSIETFAEDQYTQLEPWIQWVSVHTGKPFKEHGVFRLGDMAYNEIPQLFELLEKRGLKVGAVSPMNARNDLKQPAYFIPDPWTCTTSDGSPFSERLTRMLRQTVNDNSQGKISARSLTTLVEAVVRTLHPSTTPRLLKLVAASRGRAWLKSLVLDQLIHMIHLSLLRRTQPDVSFVFFNAGAHIQHHYFFNSPHSGVVTKNPDWYAPKDADPIRDMLFVYDEMLQDYLAKASSGTRLMVATGLSQIPYDKTKFYYRLTDHAAFFKRIGVDCQRVLPRMTRDVELVFNDRESAEACIAKLSAVVMEHDSTPLFTEIEDRGNSIFATLTYPREIKQSARVLFAGGVIEDFSSMVTFVAIKNGMHSTKGYAFVAPEIQTDIPAGSVHVSRLFNVISQAALSAETAH